METGVLLRGVCSHHKLLICLPGTVCGWLAGQEGLCDPPTVYHVTGFWVGVGFLQGGGSREAHRLPLSLLSSLWELELMG